MQSLPEELISAPSPLVVIMGEKNLSETVATTLKISAISHHSVENSIQIKYEPTPHNLTVPYNNSRHETAYDTYTPSSILKSNWLHKHHNVVPAVYVPVFLISTTWDLNDWSVQEPQILQAITHVKHQCGRGQSLSAVMILRGAIEPARPGQPTLLMERLTSIRDQMQLDAKAYIIIKEDTLEQPDDPTIIKLNQSLRNAAFNYYKGRCDRLVRLLQRVNTPAHFPLRSRLFFKLAQYQEFRGMPVEALRSYIDSFNLLIPSRMSAVPLQDVMSQASLLNFKIMFLYLKVDSNHVYNAATKAVNQFHSLMRRFDRAPDDPAPTLDPVNSLRIRLAQCYFHNWVHNQYLLCAELIQLHVPQTSIDLSPQLHVAPFLNSAALAVIRRRKCAALAGLIPMYRVIDSVYSPSAVVLPDLPVDSPLKGHAHDEQSYPHLDVIMDLLERAQSSTIGDNSLPSTLSSSSKRGFKPGSSFPFFLPVSGSPSAALVAADGSALPVTPVSHTRTTRALLLAEELFSAGFSSSALRQFVGLAPQLRSTAAWGLLARCTWRVRELAVDKGLWSLAAAASLELHSLSLHCADVRADRINGLLEACLQRLNSTLLFPLRALGCSVGADLLVAALMQYKDQLEFECLSRSLSRALLSAMASLRSTNAQIIHLDWVFDSHSSSENFGNDNSEDTEVVVNGLLTVGTNLPVLLQAKHVDIEFPSIVIRVSTAGSDSSSAAWMSVTSVKQTNVARNANAANVHLFSVDLMSVTLPPTDPESPEKPILNVEVPLSLGLEPSTLLGIYVHAPVTLLSRTCVSPTVLTLSPVTSTSKSSSLIATPATSSTATTQASPSLERLRQVQAVSMPPVSLTPDALVEVKEDFSGGLFGTHPVTTLYSHSPSNIVAKARSLLQRHSQSSGTSASLQPKKAQLVCGCAGGGTVIFHAKAVKIAPSTVSLRAAAEAISPSASYPAASTAGSPAEPEFEREFPQNPEEDVLNESGLSRAFLSFSQPWLLTLRTHGLRPSLQTFSLSRSSQPSSIVAAMVARSSPGFQLQGRKVPSLVSRAPHQQLCAPQELTVDASEAVRDIHDQLLTIQRENLVHNNSIGILGNFRSRIFPLSDLLVSGSPGWNVEEELFLGLRHPPTTPAPAGVGYSSTRVRTKPLAVGLSLIPAKGFDCSLLVPLSPSMLEVVLSEHVKESDIPQLEILVKVKSSQFVNDGLGNSLESCLSGVTLLVPPGTITKQGDSSIASPVEGLEAVGPDDYLKLPAISLPDRNLKYEVKKHIVLRLPVLLHFPNFDFAAALQLGTEPKPLLEYTIQMRRAKNIETSAAVVSTSQLNIASPLSLQITYHPEIDAPLLSKPALIRSPLPGHTTKLLMLADTTTENTSSNSQSSNPYFPQAGKSVPALRPFLAHLSITPGGSGISIHSAKCSLPSDTVKSLNPKITLNCENLEKSLGIIDSEPIELQPSGASAIISSKGAPSEHAEMEGGIEFELQIWNLPKFTVNVPLPPIEVFSHPIDVSVSYPSRMSVRNPADIRVLVANISPHMQILEVSISPHNAPGEISLELAGPSSSEILELLPFSTGEVVFPVVSAAVGAVFLPHVSFRLHQLSFSKTGDSSNSQQNDYFVPTPATVGTPFRSTSSFVPSGSAVKTTMEPVAIGGLPYSRPGLNTRRLITIFE